MSSILLDLNNPIFQKDLFALSKSEAIATVIAFQVKQTTITIKYCISSGILF